MGVQVTGASVAEIAGLERILSGVQAIASALLSDPNVWPQNLRAAVQATSGLIVQLRTVRLDQRVSQGIGEQGIWLEGIILVRRANLGILGEGQNTSTAQAIYGALALGKIGIAQVQNVATDGGPNADVTLGGDITIVNTAGDGRVDLAMQIPWRARCALHIGTFLEATEDTSP